MVTGRSFKVEKIQNDRKFPFNIKRIRNLSLFPFIRGERRVRVQNGDLHSIFIFSTLTASLGDGGVSSCSPPSASGELYWSCSVRCWGWKPVRRPPRRCGPPPGETRPSPPCPAPGRTRASPTWDPRVEPPGACPAPWCTVQYSILHYITLQYSIVQYSTVQYITVYYITVQYSLVQYNSVKYSTILYSTVK